MLHDVPLRRYRFAGFEFRARTGELWFGGQDRHLPDQAGQILLALLKASGDLVSREALKELLWPDKAHGDFEGGINAAVRKLRQVLGDDGEESCIIGTLPRRGYRLLVPVECLEEDRGEAPAAPFQEPVQQTSGASERLDPSPVPRKATTTPSCQGRLTWQKLAGGSLALLLFTAGFLAVQARRETQFRAQAKEEVPGFARVRAGQFLMGSPMSELFREGDENQHWVTLSRDFLMAKHAVTVGEWRDFTLSTGYLTEVERKGNGWVVIDGVEQPKPDASWRNPYFPQTDLHPVVLVTWDDAIAYCNWRSVKEGLRPAYMLTGSDVRMDLSANGYRLPTESEWEYAARGGEEGAKHYAKYAGSDDFEEVAWCSRNSGNGTHPVGQKKPNALGLYDMSGNVDQWCWDLYGAYPNEPTIDPTGGHTGIWRVHRGGSWLASPGVYIRTAYRYTYKTEIRTTIGFRVVRNP